MPAWKRLFDITMAVVALGTLWPLLLALGAAVYVSSSGPILFRQRRTGFRGRPFVILKFRTLWSDCPANSLLWEANQRDGPAFKIEDDPRATPIGRFLRASGLDELPQLWNILLGEMSWVGPRPLPCQEAAECLDWQKRREEAVPGLTGLWQIRQREVSFHEWMALDLEYLERRSFRTDCQVLLATPFTMLRRLKALRPGG